MGWGYKCRNVIMKNNIQKKIKAKIVPIPGTDKLQVLFKKGLTSETKSNLVALGVALHLELGHDVSTINSSNNGEILGVQGTKEYVDDILKYHNLQIDGED